MIIQDIYNRFEILPSLQLHMLRVAAVTQEICKQVKDKLSNETKTLITLSLLHDLGNLVKFDISLFPKLFEPK
jgi:5'-deoxynucleotidase YfbR-like HD superfamily hydrolase